MKIHHSTFAGLMIIGISLVADDHAPRLNRIHHKQTVEKSSPLVEAVYSALRGAAATVIVDTLRSFGNFNSLDLYGKYGICRDQATGQITVLAGALLHAKVSDSDSENPITLQPVSAHQIAGALFGSMVAKVARKMILG